MPPTAPDPDERVLVLAPTGRDGRLTQATLARAGLEVEVCSDLGELCRALSRGCGAALVAEEALSRAGVALLVRALDAQPVWSDVPVLVSTGAGEMTAARQRTVATLGPRANVILLERPLHVFTLVSSVQSALRARRRQYALRDALAEMDAQMRELEATRAARDRFVSVLAHDLRNPLTAARLYASRLGRGEDVSKQHREMAWRIARSIDRADRMIGDLLDVHRIQAGQPLPLRLQPSDLVTIARGAIEELGIPPDRIAVEGEESLRGIWDENELRRALWNLLSNANKHGAPDAPITLAVHRGGAGALVAVHNQGAPIPPDDLARIFEPFARAGSARAAERRGWGLGLTLVRGCAEAHGGSVHVVSTSEAGTTFTIELPLDARPFQPRPSEKGRPQSAGEPLHP